MRPTGIPTLFVLAAAAAGFGAVLADYFASRGSAVPVSGWITGALLLVMAGVILAAGLPLRRYMLESQERAEHPTLAPRRHSIDMTTAFRTVILARAGAYTGAMVGGVFAGLALFLWATGFGTVLGALLPTAFAALCGLALAIIGVVVERWGTLPPEDGGGATEEESTPA